MLTNLNYKSVFFSFGRDNRGYYDLLERGADPVKGKPTPRPLTSFPQQYNNYSGKYEQPTESQQNDINKWSYSLLLDFKVDPNLPDARNNPPLFSLHISQVKYLAEAKADINAKNGSETLLASFLRYIADRIKKKEDAEARLPWEKRGRANLLSLAQYGDEYDLSIVYTILELKGDPNIPDKNGLLPIFYLSSNDNLVLRMLKAKADPNSWNVDTKETLLHKCCNSPLIVKQLLLSKADAMALNSEGNMAIHITKSPQCSKML